MIYTSAAISVAIGTVWAEGVRPSRTSKRSRTYITAQKIAFQELGSCEIGGRHIAREETHMVERKIAEICT